MNLALAEKTTKELMNQHNLVGWLFAWNNKKRAYGTCSYSRKTIYLSSVLTPHIEESGVLNTILHEIAHALVGSGHGHDYVWQNKAIEIGCNGQRCSSHDTSMVQSKYSAVCDCGITHKAHRKPKRSHWCKCKGRRFNPLEAIKYVQNF